MVKANSKPDDDLLSSYYQTSTGRMVRHLIARKLKPTLTALFPSGRDDLAIATLGYMRPYLKYISDHYPHLINLQTHQDSITPWPRTSPHSTQQMRSRQSLVDITALPLLDASLDGLFIIHGIERALSPHDVISEAWRVLKSQGSMVLVVPHRGSIWASRDDTPFGLGQPYSMNQIKTLLKDHDFEVGKIHQSLAAPPSKSSLYPRYAPFVERLPHPFGGVLIVEARKMIYSIKGKPSGKLQRAGDLVKASSASPSRSTHFEDLHKSDHKP